MCHKCQTLWRNLINNFRFAFLSIYSSKFLQAFLLVDHVGILGLRACLLQNLCKMRICRKWPKVISHVDRTEKMKLIEGWIILPEQFSNTTNGLVTSPVLTLLPTVTQCISDQSWHVFLILASHHFQILSAIRQKREITY